MKLYVTTRTKYKARVQMLNRHQIPFKPSPIDEVVLVELADASTLYVSLKPHYDEIGYGGFISRFSATEKWQFRKNQEFLAWLRARLDLPAQLEETEAMRLPFGKYRGALAQDIITRDLAYIEWLLTDSFLADCKKDYLTQLLEEAGYDAPNYSPAEVYSYRQLSELIQTAGVHAKIKFIADEMRLLLEDSSKSFYQYYQLAQPCYDRLLNAVRPARRSGKAKLQYTQPEACTALEVHERKIKLQALLS